MVLGPWQLVVILVIVVLIFGTKKLRNMGGDVGSAVKEFKKAVKGSEVEDAAEEVGTTIEGEVTKKTKQ